VQPKKHVLKRSAWGTLPQTMRDASEAFLAKEIFWFEEPLPPTTSHSYNHDPHEERKYLDYVRDCLDRNQVDKHKARSFVQGLRVCGKEGEKLIEHLKKKVIK